MTEAQRFRDVIVSAPNRKSPRHRPAVGISTDVDKYIQLDEDRLRWLVEEAGPRALEAIKDA